MEHRAGKVVASEGAKNCYTYFNEFGKRRKRRCYCLMHNETEFSDGFRRDVQFI